MHPPQRPRSPNKITPTPTRQTRPVSYPTEQEAEAAPGRQQRAEQRRDYGQIRLRVLALLQGRVHAVVVTPREGELRVISFRRANRKEGRLYEHHQEMRS